jgi:hypothetical protein
VRFEEKIPIFEQQSLPMGDFHEPSKSFRPGRAFADAVHISGIPTGSINIDEWFDTYIKTLLRDLGCTVDRPSLGERFQDIKASLGMVIVDSMKAFQIPVSGGYVSVKR